MSDTEARAFLQSSPFVDIAFVDDDGGPVVRTVNAVVVGDQLAFHGSKAGEKAMLPGRPAVATAKRELAIVPSYFLDPERACPATSYYRSVQVKGRFEVVEAPDVKADVLARLMARFQPEGGHVPIDSEHSLYKKAIRGVQVMAVPMRNITGKENFGQSKTPEVRKKIMEGLWARGEPNDVSTIEHMRRVNRDPAPPDFLQAPAGLTLHPEGRKEDLPILGPRLRETYWNEGRFSLDVIEKAQENAAAWVVAKDEVGKPVGTARAISDRIKTAWIGDVWVDPAHRGRGVGRALMRLILDHPAVRGAQQVHLMTRDAQLFYAPFGFEERPAEHAYMVRVQR